MLCLMYSACHPSIISICEPVSQITISIAPVVCAIYIEPSLAGVILCVLLALDS